MDKVTFIDQSLLDEELVTEEVTSSSYDTEFDGIELEIEETPLQQDLGSTTKVESGNTLELLVQGGKGSNIFIIIGIFIAILISLILYKLMKGR